MSRPREALEHTPIRNARLATTARRARRLAGHVAGVVAVVEALHALGLA